MPWSKLSDFLNTPTKEDLRRTSEQLKEIARDLRETSASLAVEVERLKQNQLEGK